MKHAFIVFIIALMLISCNSHRSKPDESESINDMIELIKNNDILIGLTVGEYGGFAGSIHSDYLKDIYVKINNKKYDFSDMEFEIEDISDSLSKKEVLIYNLEFGATKDDVRINSGTNYLVEVFKSNKMIYGNTIKTPISPKFDDELHYDEQGDISIKWSLPEDIVDQRMRIFGDSDDYTIRFNWDEYYICDKELSNKQSSYTFTADEKEKLAKFDTIKVMHNCAIIDKHKKVVIIYPITTEHEYRKKK